MNHKNKHKSSKKDKQWQAVRNNKKAMRKVRKDKRTRWQAIA